jgi:hypothetical protein
MGIGVEMGDGGWMGGGFYFGRWLEVDEALLLAVLTVLSLELVPSESDRLFGYLILKLWKFIGYSLVNKDT